jgi:hypothetical protein
MRPLLDIAFSQLGVQEEPKGSNWGKDVKKYLNSVGINFPASWCMAFVYWCHKEAGLPAIKTGGVLAAWNKGKKYRVTEPQPGDVFIMDYGKGLGHTGIIEKVEGEILHTIEGNTNDTGSREGYEVCRKIRNVKKIKGYLRYRHP